MMLLWVAFLACEPSGGGLAGPQILLAAPVGTPGGEVYLLTDEVAARVEVLIDGEVVPAEPFPSGLILASIPQEQPLGAAELSIRVRGTAWNQARSALDIVPPHFVRVEEQTGLAFRHDISGWSETCAQALTGVGFADVDLDGDWDALVGNLGAGSVFFRNLGDTGGDGLPDFEEDTDAVGLQGIDLVATVNFADFDNDGDPDLFVGRRGRNRLLRNEGGVFVDVSDALGLPDHEQRTMGGGWGDWDDDGDLDLYVSNHAWCFPSRNEAVEQRTADHFYRNDGTVFTEQTAMLADDVGQVSGRYGFVSVFVDFDRDHDQDLVVVNDVVPNGGPSLIWENQGFALEPLDPGSGFVPYVDPGPKAPNLMGIDLGDLNGDGRPDFAYSNIGHNGLVLSSPEADDRWVDGAEEGGVWRWELPWYERSITWATHLFDYDNDGDLDILYIGGDLRGQAPQPHAFFENLGDNTFVDRTWEAGLQSHHHGKASALVDLDGDGLLEMVVANWAGELEVYRNDLASLGNRNHWLQVELEGDGERVSRDAFGAIVELTQADGRMQTCFRNPRPSLSATGDPACHFGLGASDERVDLRVVWPHGVAEEYTDIAPDQRVVLEF